MPKIPQSLDDLRTHLTEQLGFLRRSAEAYDSGYLDEAKRLAVTIRVLVHETKNSRSLLAQLGETNLRFYNTAVPDEPGNVLPYGALIQMTFGSSGAAYWPILDDPLPSNRLPAHETFDVWWATPILRNLSGQSLSRKDLVLSVANQDGGAHVDPTLNEAYAKLSREGGMGWVYEGPGGSYVVRPPELAAVRQVAHEIMKTFEPGLEAHPKVPENTPVLFGGALREATAAEIREFERKYLFTA